MIQVQYLKFSTIWNFKIFTELFSAVSNHTKYPPRFLTAPFPPLVYAQAGPSASISEGCTASECDSLMQWSDGRPVKFEAYMADSTYYEPHSTHLMVKGWILLAYKVDDPTTYTKCV